MMKIYKQVDVCVMDAMHCCLFVVDTVHNKNLSFHRLSHQDFHLAK